MHILCIEDEPLAMDELVYIIQDIGPHHHIYTAQNPSEAFIQLMKHPIDVIFLDIQLADESGMEFAHRIQSLDQQPGIIFATAYESYALEAFRANAIDYILKPYDEDLIRQALCKAEKFLMSNTSDPTFSSHADSPSQNQDVLSLKHDDVVDIIQISDILAMGIEGGIVQVYTHVGQYPSHDRLHHLIELLPPHTLFQVHRSFYIRLSAVTQVQPWFNQTLQVTLSNQVKIPVSRHYVHKFKDALNIS